MELGPGSKSQAAGRSVACVRSFAIARSCFAQFGSTSCRKHAGEAYSCGPSSLPYRPPPSFFVHRPPTPIGPRRGPAGYLSAKCLIHCSPCVTSSISNAHDIVAQQRLLILRSFQKREKSIQRVDHAQRFGVLANYGDVQKAPLFHDRPYIVQQVAGTAVCNILGHRR